MKISTKANYADYATLFNAAKAMDTKATFLDAALDDLFDETAQSFDLTAAGAILSELESLVFQLRTAMFVLQNSDLPSDDGAMESLLIELAVDVCDMRDALMDALDEVFSDVDAVFDAAITEAGETDDLFFVRVPADSVVEIDGTICDFSDCAEDGVIAVPVEPGEALVVDGEVIDVSDCESGEVYSIIDGDGEDDGDESADDEFMVWIPGSCTIVVNGDAVTADAEALDKDGNICLVLCKGDVLTVDGHDVDLTDCEPGGEYDLTEAD